MQIWNKSIIQSYKWYETFASPAKLVKIKWGGWVWTDLRKLFTITFQLQTGLDDLDS